MSVLLTALAITNAVFLIIETAYIATKLQMIEAVLVYIASQLEDSE